MNSGSWAAYRSAAPQELFGEPDDYPPERQTRCSCGAFLPKNPTFEGGKMEVERDYGEFNPWTDEWEPCLERETVWLEPTTTCGKCGREWTEAALWGCA